MVSRFLPEMQITGAEMSLSTKTGLAFVFDTLRFADQIKPGWRNWQTRRIQNPMSIGRAGSSPAPGTHFPLTFRCSWHPSFVGMVWNEFLTPQVE